MEQGSQYYFYHNDHLGTPQQMTSVSGAVVWAAEFGAFGKAQVDEGSSVVNNLRFPGQYYDSETGLHYNWNRYYEPGSGRYLRVDPVGFEDGANLFVYANNNPLKQSDYTGELSDVDCYFQAVREALDCAGPSLGPTGSDLVGVVFCAIGCVFTNVAYPVCMACCITAYKGAFDITLLAQIGPCLEKVKEHYKNCIMCADYR